jgi:hypothetical protein
MTKKNIWAKYSYLWVTVGFFLLSLIGHWIFAWFAYIDEQHAQGAAVRVAEYLAMTTRDTLENWQSEFLQLIWQVAGLAFLLFLGSPQSKEGDQRKEEKLDEILKKVAPEEAERIIKDLDSKYPKS